MKTSVPDDQFATSLKNGKLGIFRLQTTRDEIEALLSNQEVWRTEYDSLGIDQMEIMFETNSNLLRKIIIKFPFQDLSQPWMNIFGLAWLNWLSNASLGVVSQALQTQNISFRLIEFTDGSQGLLRLKSPVSVMIIFSKEDIIESLYLDFYHEYHILNSIKSIESYNL